MSGQPEVQFADPNLLGLHDRTLRISRGRPLLMGILNASPESFSNDGEDDLDRQIRHAERLVEEGASIIDVGGESGVTNTPPIEPAEEIRRVVPLVARLVERGVVVSVDTWKAPVARAVLSAGAHLINDVSGLRDPALAEACAQHRAALVVMHTRAEPKQKSFPAYADCAQDVISFLTARIAVAEGHGIAREQLIVDPGPDFAKTPAQTVAALRALPNLVDLGRPVLLAVSRKDFIGALTGRMPRERLAGTLAAIGAGIDGGASIVRVHDVGATRDYLTVRAALNGAEPVDDALLLPEHLRREPATMTS